jgi:hypothetical protein
MRIFLLGRAKEVRGLNWRVLFLAVLLVSAVVVTIGVAVSEFHLVSVLDKGFPRVADPSAVPLEVIDEESPPG